MGIARKRFAIVLIAALNLGLAGQPAPASGQAVAELLANLGRQTDPSGTLVGIPQLTMLNSPSGSLSFGYFQRAAKNAFDGTSRDLARSSSSVPPDVDVVVVVLRECANARAIHDERSTELVG